MMVILGLYYEGQLHVSYKDTIRLEFFMRTTKAVDCMPEECGDGCTNTTRLRVHNFLHPMYACIPAKKGCVGGAGGGVEMPSMIDSRRYYTSIPHVAENHTLCSADQNSGIQCIVPE